MISRLRPLALVFICVIILSLMPVFEVSAESPSPSLQNSTVGSESINATQGEVLVKFKPRVSAASAQNDHSRVGTQEIGNIKKLGVQEVKLPKGMKVDEAVAKYRKMADVEYAEPNYIRRACVVPNDLRYTQQWGLSEIKAPEAWDVTTGGQDVIIAIVDTGVYKTHEDLAAKLIGSYDFETDHHDPDFTPDWSDNDLSGHGTHVAGIAAALTNNSTGVAGVSWGAKILSAKVLNMDGIGYDDDIARAITYAADHGAKIINLSLGGPEYSQTTADTIRYAHEHGCVVVAAAGNDSTSTANYPAAYPNVIAVSAIDRSGSLTDFSNFGPDIAVAAPGSYILSTYSPLDYLDPGLSYEWLSGTSMATPFVSGLAALVISRHPNWTADQVTRSIEELADDRGDPGRDDEFGYGLINARRTVEQEIDSYEETDNNVCFNGRWNPDSSLYASAGHYKASNITTDSASLNFYGTGVTWVAKKGHDCGIASVYIDNVKQPDVDLYAPIAQNDHWQALAFKKDDLPLDNHTIRIVVSGNKNPASSNTSVNIDALDVFSVDDTTSPSAPGSPAAFDRPNDEGGAINLSWSSSTDNVGVTGYKIYRGTTSGTYTTSFGVGNVTSYTDTGLTNGTTYYYKITAVDAARNESSPSVEVSAVPIDSLTPAVPTGLTAAVGESQATLWWNANTDPDLAGYNIYRDGVKLNTAPMIAASYTDTGLTDGITYSYQITAVDRAGNESAKCSAILATPFDTISPAPPGYVSAVATGSYSIELSWDGASDNVGVTSYLIQRSRNRISFYPLAWVLSTTFTDTGLARKTTYYYRIIASDARGNISSPSGIASAKTLSRSVRASRSSKKIRGRRSTRSTRSRGRISRVRVSSTRTKSRRRSR